MAKKDLNFDLVYQEGIVTTGTSITSTSQTLWRGSGIALEEYDKIVIPSFTDGYESVNLYNSSNMSEPVATLNADENSYTVGTGDDGTYYLVANNKKKGIKVRYKIERAPVTSGYNADVEGQFDILEIGEKTYYKDPNQNYPSSSIRVPKGDTIRLYENDLGSTPLIAKYDGSEAPIELTSSGYTASGDKDFVICGDYYYHELAIQYQIINNGVSELSTAVDGTQLYIAGTPIKLKQGDTLYILSGSSVTVLDAIGNVLGDNYYVAKGEESVFLGHSLSGVSLTYSILEANPKYQVEYKGGSGILTMKRAEGGKVHFYADAGIGYMEIGETKAKEIMYFLNMEGLDKVKIVSDTEVTSAKVSLVGNAEPSEDDTEYYGAIGTFAGLPEP